MTDVPTPTPPVDEPPPEPTTSGPAPVEAALLHPTRRTRISGLWVSVVVATVVLTLLLVFILQNTKAVKISYFTANGSLPLGVALLLSAIGGVLFAAAVASLRIWQLRRRLNPGQSGIGGRRMQRRTRRPKTTE